MPADGANGLLIKMRDIAIKRHLSRFVVPIGYGEVTHMSAAPSSLTFRRPVTELPSEGLCRPQITPAQVCSFHPTISYCDHAAA